MIFFYETKTENIQKHSHIRLRNIQMAEDRNKTNYYR